MLIDFSGGCEAPDTVTVQAITRTIGLYELAVWKHDRSWYWAVFVQDTPQAQGQARSKPTAMAAAEAAAGRLSASAQQ